MERNNRAKVVVTFAVVASLTAATVCLIPIFSAQLLPATAIDTWS
ncbi:MAG TPA: hypothetical protein VEH06_01395 [Candidatus Bathyarchaeia archaeon]|jgi:hypothetical protein|nr:hypothetical protein [Candidatus Bathyarchaeia archaeon]